MMRIARGNRWLRRQGGCGRRRQGRRLRTSGNAGGSGGGHPDDWTANEVALVRYRVRGSACSMWRTPPSPTTCRRGWRGVILRGLDAIRTAKNLALTRCLPGMHPRSAGDQCCTIWRSSRKRHGEASARTAADLSTAFQGLISPIRRGLKRSASAERTNGKEDPGRDLARRVWRADQ